MRRLPAGAAAALSGASAAFAHEPRPACLEVRETAPVHFDLL